MKSKIELKEWLLANCVNKKGNLILSGLDFKDFKGNIFINKWKVRKDLFQDSQCVGGNLTQHAQNVEKFLYQHYQTVGKSLFQDNQKVKGKLFQNKQEEEK